MSEIVAGFKLFFAVLSRCISLDVFLGFVGFTLGVAATMVVFFGSAWLTGKVWGKIYDNYSKPPRGFHDTRI